MSLRIISGKFKGRTLKTPKSNSTRPTQGMLREAIFNICQNEIEGARFLDLYAGSGGMGLEALSRGALHATFVEQNRNAVLCIKENIAALHVEAQTHLIKADAAQAVCQLIKQGEQYDLIYIDPPYDLPTDLKSIAPLLRANGTLFLEERFHPKNIKKIEVPGLTLKDTRRFGTALLSIYFS